MKSALSKLKPWPGHFLGSWRTFADLFTEQHNHVHNSAFQNFPLFLRLVNIFSG